MRAKTHIALAIAVPVALSIVPPNAAGWTGLVLGSLLPDIDTRGAIARPGSTFFPKLLPRPLIVTLDKIGLTVATWTQRLLGHRGILHYPLWGALLVLGGCSLSETWLQWLGWGYLLHLAGDSITPVGIPLFGPFYQHPIRIAGLKTGSPAETTFALILWGSIIIHGIATLIITRFHSL